MEPTWHCQGARALSKACSLAKRALVLGREPPGSPFAQEKATACSSSPVETGARRGGGPRKPRERRLAAGLSLHESLGTQGAKGPQVVMHSRRA